MAQIYKAEKWESLEGEEAVQEVKQDNRELG